MKCWQIKPCECGGRGNLIAEADRARKEIMEGYRCEECWNVKPCKCKGDDDEK